MTYPPIPRSAGDGGVRVTCAVIGAIALVITLLVAVSTEKNSAPSAAAPPGISANGSTASGANGPSGPSGSSDPSDPNAEIGTVPAEDVDNPVTTGKQLLARLPLPGDAVKKGEQRNSVGNNSLIVTWSIGGTLKAAVEYYRARIPGLGLTWLMGASGRTSKVADEYYGQLMVGRNGSQFVGNLSMNNKRYTYVGGTVPRGQVSLELIVTDASR